MPLAPVEVAANTSSVAADINDLNVGNRPGQISALPVCDERLGRVPGDTMLSY